MGVEIDGLAYLLLDIKSVVLNASFPGSKLNKRCNFITYHAVRWAAAENYLRVLFEAGKDNFSYTLTEKLE